MHSFLNSPLQIGTLTVPHRLIQGPLAGYSCAPFRELFNQFTPPAYCVSEMCSAYDIVHHPIASNRYLHRSPVEQILAYQISGTDAHLLSQAAAYLQRIGADLIDINCGCPKTKIRKKGAGSALLEKPQQLKELIQEVRAAISIPLTIKIRIQGTDDDMRLAKQIEEAGADALIVHGRRWHDDYDVACNLKQIAKIKQCINIPVIANGDIDNFISLEKAIEMSHCDGFMVARAGCGKPWLYEELLGQKILVINLSQKIQIFMQHLQGLAALETEYKAVLQSKSLVRYYFKNEINTALLKCFYLTSTLNEINDFFMHLIT